MTVRPLTMGLLAAMVLPGCATHAARGTATHHRQPRAARPAQPSALPSRPRSGDRAMLRDGLIGVRDLGPGWTRSAPLRHELRCRLDPFRPATAVANSPRLQSDPVDVQDMVALFPSVASSRRAYATLNSRAAIRCFAASMRKRLSREGTPAPLELIREEQPHRNAFALRFVSQVSSQAGSLPVYIDLIQARTGRGIQASVLLSRSRPVAEATYEAVVGVLLRRFDTALAPTTSR